MIPFRSQTGHTAMTDAKTALLPDRGIVRVSGEDAEKLLQGVVTNDMDLLAGQPALHAALLTPQGKILFDFFVARSGDGFLLETAKEQAEGLAKRLTMYRLRAKVDIRDATEEHRVMAVWGGSAPGPAGIQRAVSFTDPRLPAMGLRILADATLAPGIAGAAQGMQAAAEEFHAHRISLGVPEAGKDYALGDCFPHEANLDLLNGVSFSKGCFVGQEVVSRMQHRGTARKRIVIVEGDAPLRSGSEIMAGPSTIGTVGSVAGSRALALVRLDRAEAARSKGDPFAAGGGPIRMRFPDYLKLAASAGAP
jgi:folate-binding protein YgfZ